MYHIIQYDTKRSKNWYCESCSICYRCYYLDPRLPLISTFNFCENLKYGWATAYKSNLHAIPNASLAQAAQASMKASNEKSISLLVSIYAVYFFFKIYFCSCFSYIVTKEMGNRDAIKVCVNVEIKFWFMQKKLLFDHTGSEMKNVVFDFRQWLTVIQKPGLLF